MQRQKLDYLDTAILQIKSLVPKTQEYLEQNLDSLMERYVIPEIRSIALAMNMPQGFADGVGYVKINRNTISIVNRWGTKQKPLALWFNNGTRDHGPKYAKFLHWIDKKTGQHIYAKFVRGIPATHAMEKGIEIGMNKLKNSISTEIKDKVGTQLGI